MKVWITGMGAVSSLGKNVQELFVGLREGASGIRTFPEWKNYAGLHCHLGAPAPDVDLAKLPRSARRTMSRMSELATVATFEALAEAQLPSSLLHSPRTLLMMGSTSGSPVVLEQYFKKLIERGGPEGQLSTSFFKVMNHSVAANVASALEFHGSLLAPSSACASSAQALITGWELLQSGLYDVVIAGGADELHYTSAAVFDIALAASRGYNDRPHEASRPFDAQRDGLVVSEGAGVIILESEASVQRRGARPLAQFLSGAALCNGSHMSQSSPETMAEVMRLCLDRAACSSSHVDYVNAHATGTIHGDQAEAEAIAAVFGSETPTSSLKGHLGHSLAACGALEAIASVKMMEHSCYLPTRNLTTIDPACAMVRHIQKVVPARPKCILSNNFAFGGMNTSLLISSDGHGANRSAGE